MANTDKLTELQKRFVDYYIETGNAAEAARRAGYSAKTANRIGEQNRNKPAIKAAIDERLEQMASERMADATEVMEFFTSVMRGEVDEEVLRGIGEGAQTIDRMHLNGAQRLKAAEALAKRHGLFNEKEGNNINIGVTFIDDIDDEDDADVAD